MSDILEIVDPDVSEIQYFWQPLERDRPPSPKLIDLTETYGGVRSSMSTPQISGRVKVISSGPPSHGSRLPTARALKWG